MRPREVTLGATYLEAGQCRFLVWAPHADGVEVHIVSPQERVLPLQKGDLGYHHALIEDVEPGSLYFYRLNGDIERPDPASRSQPQDVHGPSQIVDPAFPWEDRDWFGIPLQDYILYELHVGTFTPEGTFNAMIPYLDELQELGVTAIELMPVAQFPGRRNWGYDGVYPFAPHHAYGGSEGLKCLVNACHQRGLAVVLDVVYNHLGPEGNYLRDFGPYFTDHYLTPWGEGLNFDGHQSDEVRRFFRENALYWITEYHIDGLRLDAIHTIIDTSAQTFISELVDTIHDQADRLGRRVNVIAESSLNDVRLLQPRELNGYGLDAQWSDDFHHALHALLTDERNGYYQDFGTLAHLEKAYLEGFVYSGQYASFYQRRRGSSSRAIPARKFVVCSQNHDQIGNRVHGDRLSQLIDFEGLKLAAGIVLLSPFIPLLFMGEEYGETAPFPYFISHTDAKLTAAVKRGRRAEFTAFGWDGKPPDPQDDQTFQSAKLNHHLRHEGRHGCLRSFYQTLLDLRRDLSPLAQLSKDHLHAQRLGRDNVLCMQRWDEEDAVLLFYNFSKTPARTREFLPTGKWRKLLDSAAEQWQGPGTAVSDRLQGGRTVRLSFPARSFVLLQQNRRA